MSANNYQSINILSEKLTSHMQRGNDVIVIAQESWGNEKNQDNSSARTEMINGFVRQLRNMFNKFQQFAQRQEILSWNNYFQMMLLKEQFQKGQSEIMLLKEKVQKGESEIIAVKEQGQKNKSEIMLLKEQVQKGQSEQKEIILLQERTTKLENSHNKKQNNKRKKKSLLRKYWPPHLNLSKK